MKKKLSKKMMLSITAGALVTVAVIGAGTYAWFTSSGEVAAGEFTTATVQLDAADDSYGVYNFVTGNEMNIGYQNLLESYNDNIIFTNWLMSTNPGTEWMRADYDAANMDYIQYEEDIAVKAAELEGAYEAWLEAAERYDGILELIDLSNWPEFPTYPSLSDYQTGVILGFIPVYDWDGFNAARAQYMLDLEYYTVTYPTMVAQAIANLPAARRDELEKNGIKEGLQTALDELKLAAQDLLDLIFSKGVFEEVELVTPGSLIYGTYTLTNNSDIATYFRFSEPAEDLEGIAILKAVAFNGNVGYTLEESDGYYYSEYALKPGEDITLVIGAYIYGTDNEAADGEPVQGTTFNFGGANVDLIQASNNAVNFADGWKDAGVNFIPYSE